MHHIATSHHSASWRFLALTVAALVSLSACERSKDADSSTTPAEQAPGVIGAAVPPPPLPATEHMKVSFLYVGSIGPGSWTTAHEIGRRAVEQRFGKRISTTFIENVPEGADAARAMRDQITQGSTLIFATAPGFAESAYRTATEHTKVHFELNGGNNTAKSNVRAFDARTYEAAYLAGILAGGMSRSNTIGVVAPIATPEVLRNINAFSLGAQSVNPLARTYVEWVREWFNPAREGMAAQRLLQSGIDVVLQHTDSNAVLKKAESMGRYAIGWSVDMQAQAPRAHLASAVVNWAPYYIKTVNDALNKQWHSSSTWWGLKEGAVDLMSLSPQVPADLKTKIDQAREAIKSGQLVIWKGPLRTNDGQTVLRAGEVADDDFLRRINFYVKGVEGKPLAL